ncbi:DUF6950 family protein [Chelativorans oligotrophicus]|uniref:DUF6950 family protein n=1 Tax=Chelativorans oligotrophicus TaxID=449974 RepID=UPI00140A926A|nr:hypothetical protein [Chelativorans oligotrophicus]
MREKLLAFLEQFEGKPVTWGKDDCTASCARWARESGIDVRLRPYSSQEEGHALIRTAGGLVNIWDEALADAGVLERFGHPELGDVAIIDTRTFGQVGVICGSGGICWWRKNEGGFWLTPRNFVKVWAIT